MKSKTGILCIITGVLLLVGALLLHRSNQVENDAAQKSVQELMPKLVQKIRENTSLEEQNLQEEILPETDLKIPVELLTEEDKKMTEQLIDGNYYIGFLSLPSLSLELPIMSTWSYPQLRIAPCRYAGSIRGEDLVLMAHNYQSHFGKLSQLKLGDKVIFTDMDGNTTSYEVVGKDVLDPEAVEEMTAGDFDLTLFTCTYGGASRVTVYCDRIDT